MASPTVPDSLDSLRRFRAANKGAGAKVRPAWTTGDDTDDEDGALTFQDVSRRRRRFRRRQVGGSKTGQRNEARQIPYEGPFVPPGFRPPPPPSSTEAFDAPPTTSTGGPEETGDADEGDEATETSGGFPESTSLVESITQSLGTGADPTSLSMPEPSQDSDDDSNDGGWDSDSDDESTTLYPTAQPTQTSGWLDASQTASDPLPASSTGSSPDPLASAEAAKAAEQRHHQEVETALIVVGVVTGLICIGLGIWFIIRRRMRRDADSDARSKLKRFRIPFTSSRERSWEEIGDEKLYGSEKNVGLYGGELLGYLPDKPAAAAQAPTPRMRVAHSEGRGHYATTSPEGDTFGSTFLRTSQSTDNGPTSPTESSLSSAFGNGTYIPPTPLHPPPRVQIQPPSTESYTEENTGFAPPSRRDTVYTQSSTASSVPRFRTVSSWVRQQTRRKAEDVPEQGYGLMLPDGEVPRMVQHHVVRPEGVGFAK